MSEDEARQRWTLHGPNDAVEKVELRPILMTHDFPVLMSAARAGLGIALLPESSCAVWVRRGELEVVVPDWRLPQGICHAVFPSRRGLLPAVRVFIDFLAERLPGVIQQNRLLCSEIGRTGPAAPAALANPAKDVIRARSKR